MLYAWIRGLICSSFEVHANMSYYNALLDNTMSTIVKETITFRLDRTKREALDAIAKKLDRHRSYLLNEAIANYIEI